MALAFVFPGQGSQSLGMLAELAEREPVVRRVFDNASGVLDYDLWNLVQNGPEEDLNKTERTQPAMLAAGFAVWRVWREHGGAVPTVMSGHSLGEYTALVCSRALDFTTAISLVEFRGRLMQEAVPVGQGAMAAVLGLTDKAVQLACRESRQGEEVVEPVNFNAPNQIVIAGHATAVRRAMDAARKRGAKRVVLLPVSVPAHSSLMKPSAEKMRQRLLDTEFKPPLVPEIYTVDVKKHGDPNEIRAALVEQLYKPVRWVETVRAMVSQGVDRIVECGPGRVLSGLNSRIERRQEIHVHAIDDPKSVDETLAACRDAAYA
jgi:[acyl-carrier-protein] S-malonyltransferase